MNDFEKKLISSNNEEIIRIVYLLKTKRKSFFLKRFFDIVLSILLLFILWPLFLILMVLIYAEDKGSPFFFQKRVTRYGKEFMIWKFRTMKNEIDNGAKITSMGDSRITKIGRFLREYRLDELPQLINILKGDMSFVGPRPEVPNFVFYYDDIMKTTLLLRAGVTSLASLKYKNEADILGNSGNIEEKYINIVLPDKMKYNIEYTMNFSIKHDLMIIMKTIREVFFA